MTKFVRAVDISVDRGWELVRWCRARGADDFSWREMGIVGHDDPVVQRANEALDAFRLPGRIRPTTVVYEGEADERPVKLWRLDDSSIDVLAELLPEGILTPASYREDGWIEDPTFYRAGRILLGVITHEDEAFLDITQDEADDLVRLGFSLYPQAIFADFYKRDSKKH